MSPMHVDDLDNAILQGRPHFSHDLVEVRGVIKEHHGQGCTGSAGTRADSLACGWSSSAGICLYPPGLWPVVGYHHATPYRIVTPTSLRLSRCRALWWAWDRIAQHDFALTLRLAGRCLFCDGRDVESWFGGAAMETYAEAAKFGASPTRRVLVPAISAGRQPQRGIGTLWVQTMQAVRCLRSSRTTPSTPTSGACACWGRDVLERVRMRGNGAKIALQTSSWRDTYLDCAAGTLPTATIPPTSTAAKYSGDRDIHRSW